MAFRVARCQVPVPGRAWGSRFEVSSHGEFRALSPAARYPCLAGVAIYGRRFIPIVIDNQAPDLFKV